MAELNLWLDSYNDIYSDFDSRHYLKRRISEDFLHELHVEMKSTEYHIGEMILLLPQDQRDKSAEEIIAPSLNAFFTRQFQFYQNRCRKILKKGVFFFIAGIIIMMINSWISFSAASSFFINSLKVLLEPAGWFLVWTAFDFLFYDLTAQRKERDFFNSLGQMHIHFKSS